MQFIAFVNLTSIFGAGCVIGYVLCVEIVSYILNCGQFIDTKVLISGRGQKNNVDQIEQLAVMNFVDSKFLWFLQNL
jgi:hypothetical protein